MKIQLFDKVIFRIPQFPIDATLEESWDKLKSSIALASNEFYQYIKDKDYVDYNELPEAIQITIQKYFNRARFRATPYGTFAAFGLAELKDKAGKITIGSELIKHDLIDWQYAKGLDKEWLTAPKDTLLFFTNSSYYSIGDTIRYIFEEYHKFEISEVTYEKVIADLLSICQYPVALSALTEKVQETHNIDAQTLWQWIEELVQVQLLLTNYHPNIIGDDYFKRLNFVSLVEQKFYTITKRKVTSGHLPTSSLRNLKELTTLLHQIQPPAESPAAFKEFIMQFTKRYDQREIPIMEALDPEIGIGYGGMDTAVEQSLVEEIQQFKVSKEKPSSSHWFASVIQGMGKINSFSGEPILLQQHQNLSIISTQPLSNTFSAILSESEGLLHLQHLGGITATALAGRFSVNDQSVVDYCKELIRVESNANPEVFFFDIAYTGEGRVDNINRRAKLYEYQLSILNFDLSEMPLTLNDLWITVRNGTLILFSKKLGRRLVPRLSTAYNYVRSDLPLFRLLCDLQGQDLQTQLLPDISQAFPDMDYYPSVKYKNIILFPAKWKLKQNQGQKITLAGFTAYLQSLKLPQLIKVGHADQTLLLNMKDSADSKLLFDIYRSKQELWVQEAFLPKSPLVCDDNERGFVSEHLVTLVHHAQVYAGYTAIESSLTEGKKRQYLPGSCWMYYELFCHTTFADALLLHTLQPILEIYKEHIDQWFFIRYNADGDHLRFRVKLHDVKDMYLLATQLEKALYPYLEIGQLSNVRLCSYERELERYGADLIDDIEFHFYLDSKWVTYLFQSNWNDQDKYRYAMKHLRQLKIVSGLDESDFMELLQLVCIQLKAEHHISHTGFKKINKAFVLLQPLRPNSYNQLFEDNYKQLMLSYKRIFGAVDNLRKKQLFVDLFHMHINRLFSIHQRMHEMIIYEFTLKYLKARKQKNKALQFS